LEKDFFYKQKEIKRIESIIEQQKRFNQERNYVTIRSKQKQIDRITETLVKPAEDPEEIGFSFKACGETGDDVLVLKDIEKKYEQKELFRNLNMLVKRNDKVFLTGPNGCGKTTLLRIITGQTEADGGSFKINPRAVIGYYDQTQSDLDMEKTVFDEVAYTFPFMTNTEVRKALGAFLFHGDDVFKKISSLSGGERARVSLVKLMLSKNNFLIMDEPTNHLDIASKEALENALDGYDGTLLVVSHDRYFINKLANKIYDMSKDGLTLYEGNYNYFLEKTVNSNISVQKEKEAKPNIYLQKKAEEAEIRKKKNRIINIEKEISKIEENIRLLNDDLSSPEISDNYERIMEITTAINEKQKGLELLYNEWDGLTEE
jgi:ATP-binding cassette subfamily F protein 3